MCNFLLWMGSSIMAFTINKATLDFCHIPCIHQNKTCPGLTAFAAQIVEKELMREAREVVGKDDFKEGTAATNRNGISLQSHYIHSRKSYLSSRSAPMHCHLCKFYSNNEARLLPLA